MAVRMSTAGTAAGARDILQRPPGAGGSDIVCQLERQLLHTAFMLHDGPAQSLSAASAMLHRAAEDNHDDTVCARIAAAEGLVEHAAFEIREMMCDLRPAALDADDLAEMIAEYIARFPSASFAPVEFVGAGPRGGIPRDVSIVVLRIVQEALANARRHAHARHILVALGYRPGYMVCSVVDDGVGFDSRMAPSLGGQRHWGLTSMRERAQLIGAELGVESSPGHGTRVTLRIPRTTSWT